MNLLRKDLPLTLSMHATPAKRCASITDVQAIDHVLLLHLTDHGIINMTKPLVPNLKKFGGIFLHLHTKYSYCESCGSANLGKLDCGRTTSENRRYKPCSSIPLMTTFPLCSSRTPSREWIVSMSRWLTLEIEKKFLPKPGTWSMSCRTEISFVRLTTILMITSPMPYTYTIFPPIPSTGFLCEEMSQ
jgi:hypothetical protein